MSDFTSIKSGNLSDPTTWNGLADGSFEASSPSATDWTGLPWTNGGSNAWIDNPTNWSGPAAPDGTKCLILRQTGTASQTLVTGSGTGTLTCQAIQRVANTSNQTLNVLWDGVVKGAITATSNSAWAPFTIDLGTVTAGSHTLEFQGTASTSTEATEFIDEVVITGIDATAVPGNGDTITVASGHTVTVTADAIIGTSPSDTTTNVVTIVGTLLVNPSVTFTCRGNVAIHNGTLQVGTASGGGTFEFDASQATTTTTNYVVLIGSTTADTSAILVTRGTSTSHSTIRSNAGGGNANCNVSTNTGMADCQYTDFLRMGDASNASIKTGVTAASTTVLSLHNCTFTSCGPVITALTLDATSGYSVLDCTFATGLGSNDLQITAANASGAPTREIKRTIFGTGCLCSSSGATFDYVFGVPVDSSNTGGAAAFTNCFFWLGGGGSGAIGGVNIYGSLTDCYMLADSTNSTGNFHCILPGLTATYSGLILETNAAVIGNDNSDLIYTASAVTITLTDSIICLNDIDGGIEGAGTLNFNPSAVLHVLHCSGWVSNGFVSLGDLSFGVGTLAEFKSNLTQVPSGQTGWHVNYKTQQASPTFANAMTGAGADYNGGFNLSPGFMGKGYNTNNTDATPGAHDVYNVDPGWVDGARNFHKWTVDRGYTTHTGTTNAEIYAAYEDGITALKADFVTRFDDLMAYVRSGFAPTNIAFHGTAHDGTDIGAVAYQATGNLFRPAPLTGLGTGGPFFANPIG